MAFKLLRIEYKLQLTINIYKDQNRLSEFYIPNDFRCIFDKNSF